MIILIKRRQQKHEIGKDIRRLRHKYGLSQAELGKKIGVLQPVISVWETGKTLISEEYAKKISEIFEKLESNLTGSNQQNP